MKDQEKMAMQEKDYMSQDETKEILVTDKMDGSEVNPVEKEMQESPMEEKLVELDQEAAEEYEEILDIQSIRGADAEPSAKANSKGSNISVINTKKNGRRITIKKKIIDYLETQEIEVGFTDANMVLVPTGSGVNKEAFKLRAYGKSQYVLYNTSLVQEVTKFFELDFSSVTTKGLKTKEIMLAGGIKAIVVGL